MLTTIVLHLITGREEAGMLDVYERQVRGIVLEVHSDAEAIIEMSGNWFEPKRKEVDKQEALLDVTSVLVNLIYIQDTDNIRITEIGYQYWVAEEYLEMCIRDRL